MSIVFHHSTRKYGIYIAWDPTNSGTDPDVFKVNYWYAEHRETEKNARNHKMLTVNTVFESGGLCLEVKSVPLR